MASFFGAQLQIERMCHDVFLEDTSNLFGNGEYLAVFLIANLLQGVCVRARPYIASTCICISPCMPALAVYATARSQATANQRTPKQALRHSVFSRKICILLNNSESSGHEVACNDGRRCAACVPACMAGARRDSAYAPQSASRGTQQRTSSCIGV
jgi:hypothetical protein